MPDVWFAIPGDVATLTGGYGYARRLMEALPRAGWTAHHLPLPGTFPSATHEDLMASARLFTALPEDALVLVDGLAYGVFPHAMLEQVPVRFAALVHHPLAQETGLEDADVARLRVSERTALSYASSVIVTSPHTLQTLAADYGVDRVRLFLAEPGTDKASRAPGGHAVPNLLTVATLTPRKAHDVLIAALARIKELPWTSTLVGSLERDPSMTACVRALIAQHGLQDRIALRGELKDDALADAYDAADVFVLPSRHEGYGMVFAEALAHGLPIVACDAGAVRGTVPAEAGLLAPPDDVDALADALRRVLSEQDLRRALRDAAWAYGQTLPTWDNTAACVAEALWAALP